jgi:hypothetical protein
MCRRLFAVALAWLVVGSELPARPATSAPSPVGVVTQALGAHFGTALASPGATIYDGDHLSTEERGGVRISAGASQFYLPGQSGVTLHALPKGTQAALTAGTMTFSTAKGSGVEILANAATIRPVEDQSASAQVTIASPRELLVSTTRGTLAFSYNGESEVLAEGHNYRVVLNPSDKDEARAGNASYPKTPTPGGKPPKGFLIILIGGTAAMTLWFVIKAYESPDRPN